MSSKRGPNDRDPKLDGSKYMRPGGPQRSDMLPMSSRSSGGPFGQEPSHVLYSGHAGYPSQMFTGERRDPTPARLHPEPHGPYGQIHRRQRLSIITEQYHHQHHPGVERFDPYRYSSQYEQPSESSSHIYQASTQPEHKRPRLSMDSHIDYSQPLRIDTKDVEVKKEPAYTPQVEAISPTPPDDDRKLQDTSPLKASKEELLQAISRVDQQIEKVNYEVEKLKKKQNELEQGRSDDKPVTPEPEISETKNQSIAQIIYAENRRKAEAAHSLLDGLGPKIELPLYNQPSDTAVYHENKRKFLTMKKKLILFFKKRQQAKKIRERYLSERYDQLMQEWMKKIERLENGAKRKAKDAKLREYYEKQFPELKKQREEKERFYRAGKGANVQQYYARSEAEMDQIMDCIHEQEEEERKMRNLSVIPPMILDSRQRRMKFTNNNGLIEDMKVAYKERQHLNIWTPQEKAIFKEKFLQHPKNFGVIAQYLERKSVQDCVLFYYLSKKNENYKRPKPRPRQGPRKKPPRPVEQEPPVEPLVPIMPPPPPEQSLTPPLKHMEMSEVVAPPTGESFVEGLEAEDQALEEKAPEGAISAQILLEPPELPQFPSQIEEQADGNVDKAAEGAIRSCAVCKLNLEHLELSRPLNKSTCEQYGLRPEDISEDSRVCSTCRCRSVRRRYTKCPVLSCKAPKRKVKRLRSLPTKWTELSPDVKQTIVDELQIPPECTKCCSACFNRIARRLGSSSSTDNLTPDSSEPDAFESARWTDEEIELAKKGLADFGRNWTALADVVKTKTGRQCKYFYTNYKKKFGLDSIVLERKKRKAQELHNRTQSGAENVTAASDDDDDNDDVEDIDSSEEDNGADDDNTTDTASVPSPSYQKSKEDECEVSAGKPKNNVAPQQSASISSDTSNAAEYKIDTLPEKEVVLETNLSENKTASVVKSDCDSSATQSADETQPLIEQADTSQTMEHSSSPGWHKPSPYLNVSSASALPPQGGYPNAIRPEDLPTARGSPGVRVSIASGPASAVASLIQPPIPPKDEGKKDKDREQTCIADIIGIMIEGNLRDDPVTRPATNNILFRELGIRNQQEEKKEKRPQESEKIPERMHGSGMMAEGYHKSGQSIVGLSPADVQDMSKHVSRPREHESRQNEGERRDMFGRVMSDESIKHYMRQHLMPPPAHTQPFLARPNDARVGAPEGISAALMEAHAREREAHSKSPSSTPPSLIREKSPAGMAQPPMRPPVSKGGKPNLPPAPPLIASNKQGQPSPKVPVKSDPALIHRGSITHGTPAYGPTTASDTGQTFYKAHHEGLLRAAHPARPDAGSITRGTPISQTRPQSQQEGGYDGQPGMPPGMYQILRPGMSVFADPALMEQIYRQQAAYSYPPGLAPPYIHPFAAAQAQAQAAAATAAGKDSPFESSRTTLISDYMTSQQMQGRRGGASTPQDGKDSRTASPRSQQSVNMSQGVLPNMYYNIMTPQGPIMVPPQQVPPHPEPGQVVRTSPLPRGDGRERENPSPRDIPWSSSRQSQPPCAQQTDRKDYSSSSPQRQSIIARRSIVDGTVIRQPNMVSPRGHEAVKSSDRFSPAGSRKSVSPRNYTQELYGMPGEASSSQERERLLKQQEAQAHEAARAGLYSQRHMLDPEQRAKEAEYQRHLHMSEITRIQAEQRARLDSDRWKREEEDRRAQWDAREREREKERQERDRLERNKERAKSDQREREEMFRRREYVHQQQQMERFQMEKDKARQEAAWRMASQSNIHPPHGAPTPSSRSSVDREPGEIDRPRRSGDDNEKGAGDAAGKNCTAADLINAIINQQINIKTDDSDQRAKLAQFQQFQSAPSHSSKRKSPESVYPDQRESPYKPHKFQKLDPLRAKLEAELASSSHSNVGAEYPVRAEQPEPSTANSTENSRDSTSSQKQPPISSNKAITLGEHIEAIITQDYRRTPSNSETTPPGSEASRRQENVALQQSLITSKIASLLTSDTSRKKEMEKRGEEGNRGSSQPAAHSTTSPIYQSWKLRMALENEEQKREIHQQGEDRMSHAVPSTAPRVGGGSGDAGRDDRPSSRDSRGVPHRSMQTGSYPVEPVSPPDGLSSSATDVHAVQSSSAPNAPVSWMSSTSANIMSSSYHQRFVQGPQADSTESRGLSRPLLPTGMMPGNTAAKRFTAQEFMTNRITAELVRSSMSNVERQEVERSKLLRRTGSPAASTPEDVRYCMPRTGHEQQPDQSQAARESDHIGSSSTDHYEMKQASPRQASPRQASPRQTTSPSSAQQHRQPMSRKAALLKGVSPAGRSGSVSPSSSETPAMSRHTEHTTDFSRMFPISQPSPVIHDAESSSPRTTAHLDPESSSAHPATHRPSSTPSPRSVQRPTSTPSPRTLQHPTSSPSPSGSQHPTSSAWNGKSDSEIVASSEDSSARLIQQVTDSTPVQVGSSHNEESNSLYGQVQEVTDSSAAETGPQPSSNVSAEDGAAESSSTDKLPSQTSGADGDVSQTGGADSPGSGEMVIDEGANDNIGSSSCSKVDHASDDDSNCASISGISTSHHNDASPMQAGMNAAGRWNAVEQQQQQLSTSAQSHSTSTKQMTSAASVTSSTVVSAPHSASSSIVYSVYANAQPPSGTGASSSSDAMQAPTRTNWDNSPSTTPVPEAPVMSTQYEPLSDDD